MSLVQLCVASVYLLQFIGKGQSYGAPLCANQLLVVHHAPHVDQVLRDQFVHHYEGFVEAGVVVHFAHSTFGDAEGLEARVHLRGHIKLLQAHAQKHIVNGIQLQLL